MRSYRFAVLSNARKYSTESVAKNGRNDLISVSLGILHCMYVRKIPDERMVLMKKHIIAFASVTFAGKAKALFNKAGIAADIRRTPRNIAGGCGYSVTASAPAEMLTGILERNNIPYKSISEIWWKE